VDADEPRVLLSADLWTTLYQSDPELVGKRILVNSEFVVVVGILPADFRFPVWDTQIWKADAFLPAEGLEQHCSYRARLSDSCQTSRARTRCASP
jgi:hypothetical protein